MPAVAWLEKELSRPLEHVTEFDSSRPAYVPVSASLSEMKNGCLCSEKSGSRSRLSRPARMQSEKRMRLRSASIEHSSRFDGIERFSSGQRRDANPKRLIRARLWSVR